MRSADLGRWTPGTRAVLESHAATILQARLRDHVPHPTKIEHVEVSFTVELRDGTRERVVASAWC